MKNEYYIKQIPSPVGPLRLIASEDGLAAILWQNDKPNRVLVSAQTPDNGNRFIAQTETQLNEYFLGKRKTFDVKLDFIGTDFQKEVWQALLQIPYGETRSYSAIAHTINRPKAVRAVGAANGKNPISIIAACHRVIGMNGKLTGFAGGLENKSLLLQLEKSNAAK